ncbi:xanthine dehydrogenase family protein subunit M [candidate division KSB1 bacterium]|nr:xanthine dehydrogenase family protein subunit M [candidate division KSB1 bacterium]NIR70956.1 xanthine dehydrogenase family protein subunit M [candidate division KSB1 bacterium]NIS24692.1 xanthine dehydrogenase family protein subunit M [candidate division KSB1 bacterium]NIT71601.1 xanthine dehydrogenase family protein subunit M [candidate division KSB1 bacterium]NIU25305.1 xanthine dehydrogenase family protein subunit M [candidate division KSB1 bacterium]
MNNFTYLQPKDLKEASGLLGEDFAQAIPFAGGTDALSLMKEEVVSPKKVVNLKSLPNMRDIKYESGKGLRIGALVTISEIAEYAQIAEKYAILHEAANVIASPQLRNVGTLGGNLCQRPRCHYFRGDFDCLRKGGDICFAVQGHNKYHCIVGGGPCFIVHPSDLAVALLALDARVSIFSGKTTRTVLLKEFFVLPEDDYLRENILEPGEILTDVLVPELPAGAKSGYLKFKEREVWDFALVSVGAVIQRDGSMIKSARVAFGGVAPIPWLDESFNQRLSGLTTGEEAVSNVIQQAFQDADSLQMNAYKVPLARGLMKQLLGRLMV